MKLRVPIFSFWWAMVSIAVAQSPSADCLRQVSLMYEAAQIAEMENQPQLMTRHYTDIWQCCQSHAGQAAPHWKAHLAAGLHLGSTALHQNDLALAKQYFDPLLALPSRDTTQLNFGRLLHNRAVVAEREAQLYKAQVLYLRAFDNKLKAVGSEWDMTVAQTLANLAQVCLQLNQLDSAEYYMLRYGGITLRLKGDRSMEAAQAYVHVAGVYLARQKWEDARKVCQLAFDVLDSRNPVGDTLRLIIQTATAMSRAYLGLGNAKQASTVAGVMVADLMKIQAPVYPEELWLRIVLARSFEEQTLYKQAQEQYGQAHRVAVATHQQEEHPWLLWNEARMHMLLLDYAQAEALLRQGLAYSWLPQAVQPSYQALLAEALQAQGKPQDADKQSGKKKGKKK